MHFPTRALLGIALLTFIAGCAVTRPPAPNLPVPPGLHTSSNPSAQQTATQSDSDAAQQSKRFGKTSQFDFSNPRVDSFVERYQTDLRPFYSRALERSGRFVARMSSILKREGVPEELAYLPLIESGFSTSAVSSAGAVGPWQFIPGTGRRYGLRIDQYVDERRDPVKSTEAAARYLRDLYSMFGDWHLSLAAYNTGEGNISRILGTGRADDFWEMSERGYLFRETEEYVPRFLAALQIASHPEAYEFDRPIKESVRYDLVSVQRPVSLAAVAQCSGASVSEIRELNPALTRGIVPPQGYTIRLPKGTREQFDVAYANLPPPSAVSAHRRGAHGRHGRHGLKGRSGRAQGKHGGRRGEIAVATAKSHRGGGSSRGHAARRAHPVKRCHGIAVAKRNDRHAATMVATRAKRGRAVD